MSVGRKVLVRLMALGLALAFSLAAAEVVCRLFGRGASGATPFIMDRSAHFYGLYKGGALGPPPAVSNALRIAVIGDSFTFGGGVSVYDRYGSRLEWLLNLNAGVPPAQVAVYAKSGSSTPQQLALLATALSNTPQVVILGVCLNDPEDWENPATFMRWRKQLFAEPAPFTAALLRHSALVRLVRAKVEAIRSRRAFFRYYDHLYDPRYRGWQRFAEAIREFKTTCDARQVKLAVVVFPLMSHIDGSRYPFRKQHDAIRSLLTAENISHLDLQPSFTNSASIRLEAIPGLDPHPDEIAHRIAAEAILEFLLTNNVVPAAYRPRHAGGMAAHQIWDREMSRRIRAATGQLDPETHKDGASQPADGHEP